LVIGQKNQDAKRRGYQSAGNAFVQNEGFVYNGFNSKRKEAAQRGENWFKSLKWVREEGGEKKAENGRGWIR